MFYHSAWQLKTRKEAENGEFGYGYETVSKSTLRHSNNYIDAAGNKRQLLTQKMLVYVVYGYSFAKGNTASHLCGRPLCLSPNHIYPEGISVNISREAYVTKQEKQGPEKKEIRVIKSDPEFFFTEKDGSSRARVEGHEYYREDSTGNTWNCINRRYHRCSACFILDRNLDRIRMKYEIHTPECTANQPEATREIWDTL
ncbi:hypothetical protein M3Y98_00727200 [Aphelenchoides besseyi]|nr:hypothetical protein M3Y98_00727200 [Aphelenchoides besseyi]